MSTALLNCHKFYLNISYGVNSFQFLLIPVRGYTTTKTTGDGSSSQQDIVYDLLSQKQALLMELKNYEYNSKYNENLINETENFENVGAIPANTKLQIFLNNAENAEKVRFVLYYYFSIRNNEAYRCL